MRKGRPSTDTATPGPPTAFRFPVVHVATAARRTGKLSVLREMYADAVKRGEHVHWVGRGKYICRNGNPTCPYHNEEDP